MLLIAFGAKARSGKDTAVEHLIKTYGGKYSCQRFAFADFLKAEFYDLLLQPLHEYWYTVGASFANVSYLALPHPREGACVSSFEAVAFEEKLTWIAEHKFELGNHLQIYATEYVRAKDSFHWVRLLRDKLAADKPQVALISDLRYKNEFYFVRAFQGFTVRVTREGFAGLNDGRSMSHPSETDLDDVKFDYEINVLDGEVDELKRDAETVFEMIVDSITTKPFDDDGVVARREVAA